MFNITKPLKTTEMKKSLLILSFLPTILFAQEQDCLYALNENDKFLKIEKKELSYVKFFEYWEAVSFSLGRYGENKYLILSLNQTSRRYISKMYCEGDKLFLLDDEENVLEFSLASESGKKCSYGESYDTGVGGINGVIYKLYFPLSEEDLIDIENFNVKSIRMYNSSNTYYELDRAERGLHFGGISRKRLPEFISNVETMFSPERLRCIN